VGCVKMRLEDHGKTEWTDDRLKMCLGDCQAWAESLAAGVPVVLLGLYACERLCSLVAAEVLYS
jgi:hypothetical protein